MKTIAPKILAAPNQRSLTICLVWSQQTIFSSGRHFSLAPSSAKGYYATDYNSGVSWSIFILLELVETEMNTL